MTSGKFKLSETVRFLARKLNKLTEADDIALEVTLSHDVIHPGDALQAEITIKNDEAQVRAISYLVVGMRGSVQAEEGWRVYDETAEVAQGAELPAGHELVIPVVIHIPKDAVYTVDGASWVLEARVVLDRALDPREQIDFTVAERT
ncbi:MAG: sporulation protein [Myxococcota bacterium]